MKRPDAKTVTLAMALICIGVYVAAGEAFERTSTLEFCTTACHEMGTVAAEYKQSPHYKNASGVRAVCADCHIPKGGLAKVARKFGSVNELYHKARGTIATPELFEQHRDTLREQVVADMRANGARECRNCHDYDAMDHAQQAGGDAMSYAAAEGMTCVDCHSGVGHG